MRIKHTPPPNYEQIRAHFPAADFEDNAVFVYGDTCHTKHQLSPDNVAHEATHVRQQSDDPGAWWSRYFEDPKFRLSQELEAFRAQWAYVDSHAKERFKPILLHGMARNLSGRLYNQLVSYEEARRLIVDNGT